MRDESDPYYDANKFEVNDEIEALVYQIKMPLGTNNGEVLGEYDFGCSLEGLLFTSEFYMVGFDRVVTDQVAKYSELANVYPVAISIMNIPDGMYKSAVLLDAKINGKSTFGMLLGND